MAVINQVVLYNCESYLFYIRTYCMGRDVLFHLLQLFFFCLDCLLDFCLRVCEFYLRANHKSQSVKSYRKHLLIVFCNSVKGHQRKKNDGHLYLFLVALYCRWYCVMALVVIQ